MLSVLLAASAGCSQVRPATSEASLRQGEIPPVQVGMTKQQVVSALGRPAGVKAAGRYEYYCYEVENYGATGDAAAIYVKHEDNLVVGYGRVNARDNCD
jgi:outer membrane protein assembly factor BamE (lipoprotein component of BamABCDE complex)